MLRIPRDIVDDEQVEQAVVVVVEPAGADGEHLSELWMHSRHPGLRRDIRKRTIAVVVKQLVVVDAGDVEVGATVVVIVGRRNAHPISSASNTGPFGDIGEGAIAVVSI